MNNNVFEMCGTKGIEYQGNGVQIMNSRGVCKNMIIDGTRDNGLILFTYGMVFNDVTIRNVLNNGVFIGEVNKRFPNSPLNDGKCIVLNNTKFQHGKYALNVQTDEMNVYVINPVLENVEKLLNPKSAQSNVHIIYS